MSRWSLARPSWVACALALAIACPSAQAQSAETRSTTRGSTSAASPSLELSAAIDAYSTVETLARVWASDANLVYVESVQTPAPDGSANGWTYVFWSDETREARSFKVMRVEAPEESGLPFAFDPPAIEGGWIDAATALARARAAQAKLGRDLPNGELTRAALSRGLWGASAERRTSWLF